jgi:hypothetical protein
LTLNKGHTVLGFEINLKLELKVKTDLLISRLMRLIKYTFSDLSIVNFTGSDYSYNSYNIHIMYIRKT